MCKEQISGRIEKNVKIAAQKHALDNGESLSQLMERALLELLKAENSIYIHDIKEENAKKVTNST